MDTITLPGLVAGFLITISFLPQVIKSLRSKELKDLSLETFVLLCLGAALWTSYGLIIRNLPLIIFNIIPLLLSSIILGLKLKYK